MHGLKSLNVTESLGRDLVFEKFEIELFVPSHKVRKCEYFDASLALKASKLTVSILIILWRMFLTKTTFLDKTWLKDGPWQNLSNLEPVKIAKIWELINS